MKRLMTGLLIACVLASSGSAFAYGILTHRKLSAEVAKASVLATDSSVLSNLGLKPPDDPEQRFPNSKSGSSDIGRTIIELIQDGSAFEDDSGSFFNHFYDPVNDRPLTFGLTYKKSPDWALEDRGIFEGILFDQENSFADTRRFFLEALTLSTQTERDRAWGRTFQGLGQVIHHLQDMAQPQHVRREPHPLRRSARYEVYTDTFIKSLGKADAPLPADLVSYPPVYSSTDTTTFNTPRRFWITKEDGTRETGRGTGLGISEFTVNNFVGFQQNFVLAPGTDSTLPPTKSAIQPGPDFPAPNTDAPSAEVLVEDTTITSKLPFDPTPIDGKIYYIKTPVTDKYRPALSGDNFKTSTFSIYDEDLRQFNDEVDCFSTIQTQPLCKTQGIFHLNEFNYAEARKFLLPRAVGYSAGLINYFFRGKIDFKPDTDPANPNGFLIKNLSTEDMDGTFTLYYDDENDNRQGVIRDAGGKAIGWPLVIPAGGEVQAPAFSVPSDPAPKTPGEYMLVFTGTLGEEAPLNGSLGAVVAKSVKPASSPFLLVKEGAVYQSQSLDQDWQQIGGESGLSGATAGHFINEALLFGADRAQKSVDGGRTFTYLADGTAFQHYWLTYLGGTQLLSFACSESCGFLFSSDLGASFTFTPVDEETFHYGVFSAGPWYAGNGVVFGAGNSIPLGSNALFKSTDNGASWPSHTTLDFAQWDVYSMWWNQVEGPGSVLLAHGWSITPDFIIQCGLWKSEDEGTTWRRLITATVADICGGAVNSLAIDPQGDALMHVSTGSSSSLYKSRDAGESWELAVDPDSTQILGVMYLGNRLGGD